MSSGLCVLRRQRDTSLPPPPKTAIAGPEYFGLTHPSIVAQLEALDHDRRCTLYWHGKEVDHMLV